MTGFKTNFCLLNTRPVHQKDSLTNALSNLGARVVVCPMLDIITLSAEQVPILWAIANRQLSFDDAIFVSANAVYASRSYWQPCHPWNRVFAIGPGTQLALYESGVKQVICPTIYSTHGLLALPQCQSHSIAEKKIAVFCGEQTKTLLATTLQQRGAQIVLVPCYQRCRTLLSKAEHERILKAGVDAIISTSLAGLKNLHHYFAHSSNFRDKSLIVISSAMYDWSRSHGWHYLMKAPNASTQSIVLTIQRAFT